MSYDLYKKRNGFLDLVKIIATILIIFHHFQQGTGVRFSLINFWAGSFYFGRLVELFFMISGFLMTTYISQIPEEISLTRFIIKRYLRLIPVVAVSTILDFMIRITSDWSVFKENPAGLLFETISVALGFHGIANRNFTYANGPMWYVSILILCYVVFYVCIYISKKVLRITWLLPFTVIVLGELFLLNLFEYPFVNSFTCRGYVSFFGGVLIGIILSKMSVPDKCLVPVLVSVFVLSLIPLYFVRELSHWDQTIPYIVFVCYAPLLFFSKTKIAINLYGGNTFLESIAKISFHAYCFHTPVSGLIYKIPAYGSFTLSNGLLSMIICTLIIYFVSFISYSVIEKPLVKFLKEKKI